jgi:hypothetical protein
LSVPRFLIWHPKILGRSRIGEPRLLNNYIIMDLLPGLAPRRVPKRDRSICNLIKGMTLEYRQNLQNGSQESRFGPKRIGPPEGRVMKVLGFQNAMQVAIRIFSYPPGSSKNQPMIDGLQISYAETSFSFWRANVLQGCKTQGF